MARVILLAACVVPSLPGTHDDDADCVAPFCIGGRFDDTDDTDDERDTGERPDDPPDDRPDTGDVEDWGDTGFATMWYVGNGRTEAGYWLGGSFGLAFVGSIEREAVCEVLADWYDTEDEPAACPECDWVFTLGMEDTEAEGAACGDLGMGDGMLDGWTYTWAFAETWEYDGEALENAFLLSYENYWYVFAYGGSEYAPVFGDATSFSFERYAGGYGYYYYYR